MSARREKKKKTAGKTRRRNYKKRQSGASIYFLLWAAFSAMALIIVLVFSFSQRIVMTQVYENEAMRTVNQSGKEIERQVTAPVPPAFQNNRSAYIRYLASYHDVSVFILDKNGGVLFPQLPDGAEEELAGFDFADDVALMQKELAGVADNSVVFKGDGAYVYGAKISLYENAEMYLYVGESLELVESASKQMTVRTVFIALFVFVLAFAVASAVAGWLTKPLSEMTKKAKQLAGGDFDVDFHGADYGEEMVELADTLNFARDELSKTDRMQKELIANVSHDFKTPLTMIKAYASMIMEISGDIPEKRNKHAQVIVEEADRLASLVGDVLDLSKIRSGMDTFKRETVDMSSYVYEILARFDYLKETKGYKLVADIDEDLYANVDELKIGQALYNLIGNAVNYTGEDKTVYVRLKKEEGAFRFSVTDTGAGIKPEEIATIWERYFRSSEMHKRPVKGTGLGLSIVKTVLEKHGLMFGVESEVGKGSTFYVVFPLDGENA
ncbi:MAG: ATP-binding protein [Clostridia bacterium]|nr:ATP-binding protein [Clostridia bacterium]